MAEAMVRPAPDVAQLLCTCRMVFKNARSGDRLTVKARAWDCPSCGLDKRRALVGMCSEADPAWMLTLTFTQPLAVNLLTGEAVRPARHEFCDWHSHVYVHTDPRGRESLRWRLLSTCTHCCKYVSNALAKMRKRLRRMWSGFQCLWVREDHRSGAVHVHMAVVGLPKVLRRVERARIKDAWNGCGGGFADLAKRSAAAGGALGAYLGKYLTKQTGRKMARGYRRWSRTRAFGAGVRMTYRWPREDQVPGEVARFRLVGWVDPTTGSVSAYRLQT